MITRDPRFRLLDEYSLQIKGVRPQDAGDYMWVEFYQKLQNINCELTTICCSLAVAKLVTKKTET